MDHDSDDDRMSFRNEGNQQQQNEQQQQRRRKKQEEEEEEGAEVVIFSARTGSARFFFTLLHSLTSSTSSSRFSGSGSKGDVGGGGGTTQSGHHSEPFGTPSFKSANVFVSNEGLFFQVRGSAKLSEAQVTIAPSLFDEFYVKENDNENDDGDNDDDDDSSREFCVNLSTVLECLQVLSSGSVLDKTELVMSYSAETAIFKLELQERGALCVCEITANVPADEDERDTVTSAFEQHPVVATVSCDS
jgi:hypothetical protein